MAIEQRQGTALFRERGKEMRKKLSLMLCVVMLVVMIPVPTHAGLVSGSATYTEGSVLTGGNGCHYYSSDSASLGPSKGGLMQIYYFGDDGKKHIVYSYEVEGNKHAYTLNQKGNKYRVYCFEHGLSLSDRSPTYYSKSALSHPAFAGMKASEQQNLKYTVLYGFEADAPEKTLESIGFFKSVYAKRSKGSYNRDDWYMATQILIWEITQEYRESSSGSDNLSYAGSSVHPVLKYGNGRNINIHHCYNIIKGKPAEDIYKFMLQMIKNRDKRPLKKTYDKETAAKASPVKLKKKEDGTWQADITGNSEIVKMYESASRDEFGKIEIKNPDKIKGKLTVTKLSSKKYNVTWTPPEDSPDMSPSDASGYNKETGKAKKNYEVKNIVDGVNTSNRMVLWFRDTKAGNIHDQSLISGSTYQTLKTYYMSIAGDEGEEPEEGERNEPAVPAFSFGVTKEDLYGGFDDDKSSPRGDGQLNAEYTLYRDGVAVDTVTLDSNGGTAYLEDKPYEDGTAFLDPSCEYGSRTHKDGSHSCTISPAYARWTFEVLYEIRETNRPKGYYKEPDGDIVKKFTVRYEASATDKRICSNDPVSWSDTDISMSVNTPEGVCTFTGKNDEFDDLQGTGYDFTDGVFSYTGTDGKGAVFRNDIHRGKLEIVKENENGEIFKDKTTWGTLVSEKSLWKVTLKSGGSENNETIRYRHAGTLEDRTAIYDVTTDGSGISCSETPLKVGSNGKLLVRGLPYGEYIVEEISADNPSYVKEKFICNISECSTYGKYGYKADGSCDDVYIYNVYDKLKENRIKIEKISGETGKRIPLKGTKVRIRYMGNPSSVNPALDKNYGRLLRNGSSITAMDGSDEFSLDENGEIVLKYQLPYGIYRIEEFSVPEGMYIGTEKDGKLSDVDYGEGSTEEKEAGEYETDFNGGSSGIENTDDEIISMYTFKVTSEPVHEDGNFGIKIDYDGNWSDADPAYDFRDYPYVNTYHAVKIPNNHVKGMIDILKKCEVLQGFRNITDPVTGLSILQPIYGYAPASSGGIFGVYAASDILLPDGSEGPSLCSSETDEKIKVPISVNTHSESEEQDIEDILGRIHKESIYMSGIRELDDGGIIQHILERRVSEKNKNIKIYKTAEKGATKYTYSYEKEDEQGKVRYDIECNMSYTPGGDDKTGVRIIKTTVGREPSAELKSQEPQVTVEGETPYTMGGMTGVPLSSYTAGRELEGGSVNANDNEVDYGYSIYKYHADGVLSEDWNEGMTDFGSLSEKRYIKTEFRKYMLKAEDLLNETRDGITKKSFEWKYGIKLKDGLSAGDTAIAVTEDGFVSLTTGYTRGTEEVSYEDNPVWIICEENGDILSASDAMVKTMKEEGWNTVPSEGGFIVIKKDSQYKVLVYGSDEALKWNDCDEKGDFENARVEIFDFTFTGTAESQYGFLLKCDGFEVETALSPGERISVKKIKRENSGEEPVIQMGTGCIHKADELTDIFTFSEKKAPIYLKSGDIRLEMESSGEWVRAVLTVPEKDVKAGWKQTVPTIYAGKKDGEGGIANQVVDWYTNLSSDRRVCNLVTGENLRIVSRQHAGTPKEDMYYTVEILTKNDEEAPVTVEFADGYRASVFMTEKGAGVMVVENVYKSERYALSDLADSIITDEMGEGSSNLLPLGEYIVRELDAPNGYVTGSVSEEVNLEYEDMYTPTVKKSLVFSNKLCDVQLDMKKVFETGSGSGIYEGRKGAIFGIYTAKEITAPEGNAGEGSLVGTVTCDDEGRCNQILRLPEGSYYIQEISTLPGYEVSCDRYYFTVDKKAMTTKKPFSFSTVGSGISGRIYMDKKGEAVIYFRVLARNPILSFEGHELSENYEDDDMSIKVHKDSAEVWIRVRGEKDMTLPDGGMLNIKAGDYGYTGYFNESYFSFEGEACISSCMAEMKAGYVPSDSDVTVDAKLDLTGTGKKAEAVIIHKMNEKGEYSHSAKIGEKTIGSGEEFILEDGVIKSIYNLDKEGTLTIKAYYEIKNDYKIPKGTVDGKDCDVKYYRNVLLARGDKASSVQNVIIGAGEEILAGNIENRYIERPPVNPSGKLSMKTYACEAGTGSKLILAKGDVTIADRVIYEGLNLGVEYRMEGSVADKDSGKIIAREEKTFVAQPKGELDMEFKLEGKGLAGKSLVVFESVSLAGKKILSHEDMDNEDQTVYFPEIRTYAKGTATGEKIVYAGKNMSITDEVIYDNLIKGETYEVRGNIVDAATGERIKEAKAEKTFVADESSGKVELEFVFNGEKYAGRKLVVMEKLYHDGTLVAVHEDRKSRDQTVSVPMIDTKASVRGGKIVDKIKYKGLIPEKTYRIYGRLMDGKTGKAFLEEGKEVKGYLEFIPDKSDGTVEVEIRTGHKLAEGRFVIFENMYLDDVRIASHEDMYDEDQTIEISQKKMLPYSHVKTGIPFEVLLWPVIAIIALFAMMTAILIVFQRKEE